MANVWMHLLADEFYFGQCSHVDDGQFCLQSSALGFKYIECVVIFGENITGFSLSYRLFDDFSVYR